MYQSEYSLISGSNFFYFNVHILASYFLSFIINAVFWEWTLWEHIPPGPASQPGPQMVPLKTQISSGGSLLLFSECLVALLLLCLELGLELSVLLLAQRAPHLGNYNIDSWRCL